MATGAFHLAMTASTLGQSRTGHDLFLSRRDLPRDERFSEDGARLVQPYGLSDEQRLADKAAVAMFEARALTGLTQSLNSLHQIEYPERQWKILIGHWLRRTIRVVVHHHGALSNAITIGDGITLDFVESADYDLATPDSWQALWAVSDPDWNARAVSTVAETCFSSDFIFSRIPVASPCFEFRPQQMKTRGASKAAKSSASALTTLLSGIYRRQRLLMTASYLPRRTEAATAIRLGSLPAIWPSIYKSITLEPTNPRARREIEHALLNTELSESPEGRAVASIVAEALPRAFVEGFRDLLDQTTSRTKAWPTTPEIVFCSNRFDTDDIFKMYVCRKLDKGAKYVVGQHGNNYGTYKYTSPTVEEETSDHFLTWGWEDQTHNLISAFNFRRPTGRGPRRSGSELVIAHLGIPHQECTWDVTEDHREYLAFLSEFFGDLAPRFHDLTTVRMYPTPGLHRGIDEDFLAARHPWLRLDSTPSHFDHALRRARLAVFTYDSTGLLEMMAMNRPVVAFWQGGLTHVVDWAIPLYESLVEAGIVHLDPRDAAKHINRIFDEPVDWWTTPEVQQARVQFADKLSRTVRHPSRELARILRALARG